MQWSRFQSLRTGITWLPVLTAASRVCGRASGACDSAAHPTVSQINADIVIPAARKPQLSLSDRCFCFHRIHKADRLFSLLPIWEPARKRLLAASARVKQAMASIMSRPRARTFTGMLV